MEYLHMSQVFEWFKHPSLNVSNFYSFYAPNKYKDDFVLVWCHTQYSMLICFVHKNVKTCFHQIFFLVNGLSRPKWGIFLLERDFCLFRFWLLWIQACAYEEEVWQSLAGMSQTAICRIYWGSQKWKNIKKW